MHIKLGDFCKVMTGAPISRVKKLASGEVGTKVKVLIPRAMEDERVNDGKLADETVTKVKEDLFSKEGDVIVKASTPYDCVYIGKVHEGILVTSFGLILRAKNDSPIDMRYLAAYLNQPQVKAELQELSSGSTLKLIKKTAMANLPIPKISIEKQLRLAELFENTQRRKALCYQLIEASNELLESEFSRIVFDK